LYLGYKFGTHLNGIGGIPIYLSSPFWFITKFLLRLKPEFGVNNFFLLDGIPKFPNGGTGREWVFTPLSVEIPKENPGQGTTPRGLGHP